MPDGDAAEILEISKHALDQVALAAEPCAVGNWLAGG